MLWELWDLESGNLIWAYDTEEEALQAVRGAIARHGEDFVKSWSLGCDEEDCSHPVLEGDGLIRRSSRPVSA